MKVSPLTTRIEKSYYNGKTRSGKKVERVILHHVAATRLEPAVKFMKHQNNRDSCSTYLLGEGAIVALIGEEYRPSSTGAANDMNSITVEMLNESSGGVWKVRQVDMDNLVRLLADIARRYGWKKLNKTNVRWHRQFAATACPGPYMISQIDWLIAEANKLLGTPPTVEHTVVAGETLSGLIARYETTLPEVERLNPSLIIPGDVLTFPEKDEPTPPTPPTPPVKVTVDGIYGPATEKALDARLTALGVEGKNTDAKWQTFLNSKGARDWQGKKLVVDGVALQNNYKQRVPRLGRWRSIWATQDYFNTAKDGVLNKGDSLVIRAMQRALNSGSIK